MRRRKGHVLVLFLACVGAIGALVVVHARWRLTQRAVATTRWQRAAAEVLARSALERGIADLRGKRPLPAAPFALAPGQATVQATAAGLEGCGVVKAQRICLRAPVVDGRLGPIRLAQTPR